MNDAVIAPFTNNCAATEVRARRSTGDNGARAFGISDIAN
jgi:hypothetical protein